MSEIEKLVTEKDLTQKVLVYLQKRKRVEVL